VPPVLLHNLRVLVVDDNAANRHIMEQWLRDWQMEATTVADGMAAMDALWHGVAIGKPHRLLLLDARMPDTDGLTLASKIRERAELGNSRIILLTSGDRPGDLARFRELRVDGHLLKPLQQDELLEAIYSIMSRTTGDDKVTRWQGDRVNSDSSVSQSTLSPPHLVTPSSSKLRILVAEDSEFNAQLMEKLLAKRGHTVRVASNGTEALELANVDGFDLLFLDLHMPRMDGFQVIRAIRERERETGSHLPVIALTARSRAEDRELCLAAGMDDFLAKPIKTEDLWATVERVTRLGAPAEEEVLSLIDPHALLAACGDDAGILKVICETLRQHLPAHVAEVQEAYGHHDATRLREAAHKLYGIVAAFSTVAGNVASDIEQHAARDQLGETATLIQRLNEMAAELPGAVCEVSIESLRRAAGNDNGRNRS
jgi:two-component system sensor histidine kinase/response regulator